MIRQYQIPVPVLLATVLLLWVGEVCCGTTLLFSATMAVALLSIGVTYNLLGGLSTFSGMLFAAFAARTIVISQFAKVLLWEPADKNIEAAQLTISIYAVFYLSAMMGAFLFRGVRLNLPKPLEPSSEAHELSLYTITLFVGLSASIVFQFYNTAYSNDIEYTTSRNLGLALMPMLLFSLVLAVDHRIKRTMGSHSFGVLVFIPWFAAGLLGFIDSIRTMMLEPTVVYLATCYLRGYRFKPRHFVAVSVGGAIFVYLIAPYALYSRYFVAGQSLAQRTYYAFSLLRNFHNPAELAAAVEKTTNEGEQREAYYSRPGTYVLNRLSVIRADSTLIGACSDGFHYGWAQINEQFTSMIPSFLDKNKSRVPNNNYLANVSGLGADNDLATPVISLVADSYGAFGWIGVVLFPMFGMTAIFIVYESMFDFRTPWGTVAFASCLLSFSEMNMWRLFPLVLRDPIYLVLLSYLFWYVAKLPIRESPA